MQIRMTIDSEVYSTFCCYAAFIDINLCLPLVSETAGKRLEGTELEFLHPH